MGNYVIAVGNYLIVSPSELGNYKIADTKGVMRRTGLSRTAAGHAPRRLETAGVAEPNHDSTGWRTSAATLTTPVPAGTPDQPPRDANRSSS